MLTKVAENLVGGYCGPYVQTDQSLDVSFDNRGQLGAHQSKYMSE